MSRLAVLKRHLEDDIASKTGGTSRPEHPDGIAPYGTDALRFTFASLATLSRDIRFDVGRIEGYRNFCNKLWNAARFVLLSVEGQDLAPGEERPWLADRWIRSRLEAALEATRAGFAAYRFDLASQALYEFTWYEFCDWYSSSTRPCCSRTPRPTRSGARRAARWSARSRRCSGHCTR